MLGCRALAVLQVKDNDLTLKLPVAGCQVLASFWSVECVDFQGNKMEQDGTSTITAGVQVCLLGGLRAWQPFRLNENDFSWCLGTCWDVFGMCQIWWSCSHSKWQREEWIGGPVPNHLFITTETRYVDIVQAIHWMNEWMKWNEMKWN